MSPRRRRTTSTSAQRRSREFTISSSTLTMDATRTGIQGDGVLIDGGASGSLTASITGSTFTGAAGDHIDIAPGATAQDASWTATSRTHATSSEAAGRRPRRRHQAAAGRFQRQPHLRRRHEHGARREQRCRDPRCRRAPAARTPPARSAANTIGINGDRSGSFSGRASTSTAAAHRRHRGDHEQPGVRPSVRAPDSGARPAGWRDDRRRGRHDHRQHGRHALHRCAGAVVRWHQHQRRHHRDETGVSCVDIQGNTLRDYFSGTGYFDVRVRQRQLTTLRSPVTPVRSTTRRPLVRTSPAATPGAPLLGEHREHRTRLRRRRRLRAAMISGATSVPWPRPFGRGGSPAEEVSMLVSSPLSRRTCSSGPGSA